MEMTISGLRDKLYKADNDQLIELLCQVYKHSEVAQQIVDSRFLGDDYGMRLAKTTNQRLEKAFFPHGEIDRSLVKAEELLRKFRKSCQNQRALIDVELYFVECGLDFVGIFGESEGIKELLIMSYASAVARILEDDSQMYFQIYFARCNQIIDMAKDFTSEFSQNMLDVYCQLAKE
ncbi:MULTISPECIES: hypothetical protein [Enterococcus]|uniref:Uncharacterized protein n=1 Tax=Candidatus Enterococcus murrayae TaxID=2815321 RepID=A0ABS3HF63_9ENTE|nr:hypothetical protein [Enterococcus sp. MJM16]MBO0451652.1 hypothetical protein [Enterococcus sp. MJM16]